MKASEMVEQLDSRLRESVVSAVDAFGESTLEIRRERLKEMLLYLKGRGYQVLMDLTGVDYLVPEKRTKVVYLLHHPTTLERMRVAVFALREETLPTVTDLWEGAAWYEREIYDLFGVEFDGHLRLSRLLMPDDWQGHPLRRDYPLTEESVDFKHERHPKLPSEIIPWVPRHL